MRFFLFLVFLCCSVSHCSSPKKEGTSATLAPTIKKEIPDSKNDSDTFRGLSVVAPPRPFQENPMVDIQAVNSNWIAVIPYGFCRVGQTDVIFNVPRQWWGEKAEGAKETIRLAKEAGLKVMLKPQVWVPGSWTGGITFDKDADWEKWEKSYTEYLMFYVDLIQEMEVDLLCIGTEFKQSEVRREKYWRSLIQQVKEKYKGPLTYASNWDSYQNLPFWDELDYIGVDAYFPLDESIQPKKETLMEKWKFYDKQLKKTHQQFEKPILFTEFGYMTIDGCAGKTWELESKSHTLPTNEQAQATALAALFDFFSQKEYWQGGFLWKWYPYPGNYQERGDKDYTPQGKLSEEVVKEWYGKM